MKRRHPLRHLPAPVARVLGSFYRLVRLYRFLAVAAGSLTLYLALALLVMHTDRLFFLSGEDRLRLWWLAHGTAGLVLLVRLAFFAFRRPSVRRIAYDLQERLPGRGGERFATLDDVLAAEGEPGNPVRDELLGRLRAETEAQSGEVSPFRLARDPRLVRAATGLAGLLVLYGGLAVIPGYQFPLMARRFFQPRANLPKPSFVRIVVSPADVVVGKGGEVVLQAEIRGSLPRGLDWLYRLAGAESGRCRMTARPGLPHEAWSGEPRTQDWSRVQRQLFLYTRADVRESFSYRLRCGDGETELRSVEVVARPVITGWRVTVKPPAYARLPETVLASPAQPVRVLEGSAVEVEFTVDQPVTNRRVTVNRKDLKVAWNEAVRQGKIAFTMKEKVELELGVVNARGFSNADQVRLALLLQEDRPPTVLLAHPPHELAVAPGELVPFQALAEDDLAVESATIRYVMNPDLNPDAPFQELPLELAEKGAARVTLTENLDLARTPAGPGDEILLTVRARDSRGGDGESRPVRIRVNAFSRGENERLRLAALDRVLKEGFAPEARDWLPAFLELEQHFTDAPRHKEDVRLLAWMMGREEGGEGLGREVAPMIASRRLQNVCWRLFGIREEMADIRRRLQSGSEAESGARRDREAFLGAAAAEAFRGPVREAALKERKLREQIDAIRQAARGEPDPFAPVQLDADLRLPEEDERKVAELERQAKEAALERKKQAAAGAEALAERWIAGLGRPTPLTPKELAERGRAVLEKFSLLEQEPASEERARLLAPLMAGGAAAAPADDTSARTLQRRAELSMKALEEIGIDLAAAAAAVPGRLDAEALKAIQGELNAAGYYLTRGDGARKIASCDEIASLSLRLLERLRPALPALAREEHRARLRLEEWAADSLMATVVASDLERLDAGLRMLERNPFAPVWPRALLLALWTSADDSAPGMMNMPAPLLVPEKAVPRAVREEALFWDLLALEWELDDLLALPRVSEAEKRLAAALLALTGSLEAGDEAESAALEKILLALPLEGEGSPSPDPGGSLRRRRRALDLKAIENVLAGPVRQTVLDRSLTETIREARERTAESGKALEALEAALAEGSVAVTGAAGRAAGSLARAARAAERATRQAALEAGFAGCTNAGVVRVEQAYVRIREAAGRFGGRTAESVKVLRESAVREPDAGRLADLGGDLTILKAAVQALEKALAASEGSGEGSAGQPAYPILESMKETRLRLTQAAESGTAESARVAALAYLQGSPEARRDFLGARALELDGVARQLETVERLLGQPAAEEAVVRGALVSAREGLTRFAAACALPGTAGEPWIGAVQREAGELAGVLDRLSAAAGGDARRRLADTAEAGRRVERLVRRVRGETAGGGTELAEFGGGPDGIWEPERRRQAEASRQRLLGQLGAARRGFVRGMLEPLEPKPDPSRYADAAAWALLRHRALRSPLSGVVTPPRSGESGEAARNPLVKWLLEQVDEAVRRTQGEEALRHYREATRELLPGLRDYLRY